MQEQYHTQSSNTIRVIIADDSPSFRHGILALLAELSEYIIIGETDNPEEVVHLCDQSTPDIVLLDLNLFCADGQSLMSTLRNRYPDVKLVVFLTPDDEEGLIACATNGVDGCISKNAGLDIILKAIHGVIAGECWVQQEIIKTIFNMLRNFQVAAHEQARTRLSTREFEVITFLAQGMRNQEIAEQLFISERTVKVHVSNIFDKLGVRDRVEAVRYAIRTGIVPND